MAGQIWPILGGLAMAAGVMLLVWAWRRRRRRWISDSKRHMEGGLQVEAASKDLIRRSILARPEPNAGDTSVEGRRAAPLSRLKRPGGVICGGATRGVQRPFLRESIDRLRLLCRVVLLARWAQRANRY